MKSTTNFFLTLSMTLFLATSCYAQLGVQASLGNSSIVTSPISSNSGSFTFGLGGIYRYSKNIQTGLNLQFGQDIATLNIKIPVLYKYYLDGIVTSSLGDKLHIIAGLTPEIMVAMDEAADAAGYKSFSANLTTGIGFDLDKKKRSGLQLTYDYGLNKILDTGTGPFALSARLIGTTISYNYMF